jgi:hypothetical protein
LDTNSDPRQESHSTALTPVTPITPITSEGLASLQSTIIQDAESLDEISRSRLRKHLQKFANAATISFAERALQAEQIKFLHRANNEAKTRRTTKALVLGKAKVMSYEDLEYARAKRATIEQTVGKKKRGKKRTVQAIETDALEIDPFLLHTPEFRAPVARMI